MVAPPLPFRRARSLLRIGGYYAVIRAAGGQNRGEWMGTYNGLYRLEASSEWRREAYWGPDRTLGHVAAVRMPLPDRHPLFLLLSFPLRKKG